MCSYTGLPIICPARPSSMMRSNPFCCFFPARCPSTELSTALQRPCLRLSSRILTCLLMFLLYSWRNVRCRQRLFRSRSQSSILVVGSSVVCCDHLRALLLHLLIVQISSLRRPAAAILPSHSGSICPGSLCMSDADAHFSFPLCPRRCRRITISAVRCTLYPMNTGLQPFLCVLRCSSFPARR